jgi:hypothetical protein
VGALRGLDIAVARVTVVMMRVASFAVLLSIGFVSTAVAQTATPTAGNVGSATLRNGFPVGGGAVALPNVQNSSTTTSTSTAGSTTLATTSTGITGRAGGGAGGNTATTGTTGTAGGSVSGGSRGGGGSASTAGAATATGSSGNGNFVLCPPGGAPGLEPLLIGTDLFCAPQ